MDTLDAMYQAIEDMLPLLEELDLIGHLLDEEQCRSAEDAKLVRYIRIFRRLHPRILAERRVSRTDIFDALFGDNRAAKTTAHEAYNQCYRSHYGDVRPFETDMIHYLSCLRQANYQLAIATNRSREFLDNELNSVDNGAWKTLFDSALSGNEVANYKPEPDVLLRTLDKLGLQAAPDIWYVGDSHADMVTAHRARVTPIFYNGGLWGQDWFGRIFPNDESPSYKPKAVVDDFDHLLDLVEQCDQATGGSAWKVLRKARPPRHQPRKPPPPRIEPDWHPAVAKLDKPVVILFDWHATLVDTLDAMYHAVDDVLPQLQELGLVDKLIDPATSKSPEDRKLVEYVKNYRQLHPKIKADRKISRTDIFEVLFGDNEEAKRIAHLAFNTHYRKHFGTVNPFEPKVRDLLQALNELPLQTGVITNRDREFFEQELAAVEGSGWTDLFQTDVCGDDAVRRKPFPDQIIRACENLGVAVSTDVWYVGDSTTDTVSAKEAGVTSVFYNGAQWDQPWLNKIFPGTPDYPHKPDVVVNDFSEFWALVLACLEK